MARSRGQEDQEEQPEDYPDYPVGIAFKKLSHCLVSLSYAKLPLKSLAELPLHGLAYRCYQLSDVSLATLFTNGVSDTALNVVLEDEEGDLINSCREGG